jgi:hypothetical protein
MISATKQEEEEEEEVGRIKTTWKVCKETDRQTHHTPLS